MIIHEINETIKNFYRTVRQKPNVVLLGAKQLEELKSCAPIDDPTGYFEKVFNVKFEQSVEEDYIAAA